MKGEENEDFEKLISRSKYREQLLEDIVEKSEPIMNFKNKENFLVLAREWNSWYPSTLKVKGGCYFFNINQEIIIIDPGFNTLEIIRKNELDVRQIRHIFVTHFHPDHFENLITLITRLTSEKNKLTVYLNSTTFKQFKIYSRGFTEFIELKPEFKININFELKEPLYKVNVKIEKAFHKEIGGLMNSVGLKFYIKYKDKKSHIIGFMSDTDGQLEYMEKYEQAYKDVDILVCHLGAIHKDPNGYKHLYKDGIESLLQKDELNNKIIFIGEFGFELASEIEYKKVFYEILPSNMEYGDMIKILKNSIKFKEKSEEYYKFLIELLAEKFTEYITNIDDFSPCIEIILPFLIYGRFYNKSESPLDQQNIKTLEKHFNLAAKSFDEEGCVECWRIFLKTLIYGAFDPEKCYELLYNQFSKWSCFPIFYEFNELVSEFFNYFSVPSKNKILNFIIKKFSRYPIIPKTLGHPITEIYLNETILSNLKQSVNLNSTKFKGIHDNIKHIFNSVPNRGFILLFFTYFIIRLLNEKGKSEIEKEVDGRNLICDYLRKITNNVIIAVHPSYQVHFNPNEIEIKGKNRVCPHKTIIPIKDCNKNSQIIIKVKERRYSKLISPTSNPFKEDKKLKNKKKMKEFVDIIPVDKCDLCKEKAEREYERGYPSPEYIDYMMEDHMKGMADHINNEIKGSDSIIHIFYILDSLRKEDSYAINYLDEVLFLSELKKNENTNKNLLIYYITHPLLLKLPKIKEYTISKFKILSQEDLKSFLLWILKKNETNLYFNDEYISPYYFEIFDCDEFSYLFKEIINQFNFKELYSIIDFYIGKIKNEKYIQENSMYINLRNRFTELSYPLLEDPNNHLEDYSFLEERYYQKHYIINNCYQQINELELLGYPFNNYYSKFRENIIRLIKEKILIVEHNFIIPHFDMH